MKQLYLICWTILLFTVGLHGQSRPGQEATFGVSYNDIFFSTLNDVRIVGNRSSSFGRGYSNGSLSAMGLSAGYSLKLSERWELALRANYSGRSISERVYELRGNSTANGEFSYTFNRPRKYRAIWQETLVFWRVFGPHVRPDIQIGTGFTYLYYTQDYRSGFEFDLDRGIYEVEYFTKERRHNQAIPIHLQFQYPINYQLKVGFSAYVNHFFGRNNISGVMLFGAYRLGK